MQLLLQVSSLTWLPSSQPSTPTCTTPSVSSIDDPVDAALAGLPQALPPELRARIDTALEDYRQLKDVLSDSTLITGVGVDPAAMLVESREVMLALLAQAPRVARVLALAGRRSEVPATQQAVAAALAAFEQRADALHSAASAAVQLAAADAAGDPALLRDHTENLLMLRAAHEQLRTP